MDKEIKEQRPPYARTVFVLGFLSYDIYNSNSLKIKINETTRKKVKR